MAKLSVNIDHIATLRQARGESVPDPVEAARIAEAVGAHGITVHLREDRRHIQDRDLVLLRKSIRTRLNLEMAATPEMTAIALRVRPDQVTLVPEKRKELTTEGGLSVATAPPHIQKAIDRIQKVGIPVSLFIDPDPRSIAASAWLGAAFIELHTGRYSRAFLREGKGRKELEELEVAARLAQSLGLMVHAGHGLTYQNVSPVAGMAQIEDLNIGHNIIARAAMVGLGNAVKEMLALLKKAPKTAGRRRP